MIAAMSGPAKSDLYPTPMAFFKRMDRRYGPFTLDVCALPDNAKCERYFTPEIDGLQHPWTGCCWCNPPYGKTIGQWVRKAWESSREGATVVMLVPARVDTRWWHDYIEPYAAVIDFPKGRLRFGNSIHPAPFPSAVVVFRPAEYRRCQWCEHLFRLRRTDAKFCCVACKQAAYRARRVTPSSVTEHPDDAAKPADVGTAARIDWQAAGVAIPTTTY
ncbi:MAG: DNA N-6-adenine-methyltransferase [Thermoguttaceae bacterium]